MRVNCFGHKLNLVLRRLLKQSFLLSIIDRMKSAVRRIHKSGISRRKFIGMMLGDEALIDICKEFTDKLNKATAEAYQDDDWVSENVREEKLLIS
ncbi:unnamed protein product, partial [Mesorhabditis belari]|uniref:Uncharacterized protein n=1 Tax=Mesorhabditis belari TaxID=2138241 RepID=A0AAF3EJJ3_9BILA